MNKCWGNNPITKREVADDEVISVSTVYVNGLVIRHSSLKQICTGDD